MGIIEFSANFTMIEVNDDQFKESYDHGHDHNLDTEGREEYDASKSKIIEPKDLESHATPTNPLGNSSRIPSMNNSNFSLTSNITSYSAKHTSPVNLTLCTLLVALASGSIIIAGHLIQNLMNYFRSPGMLTYLSVSSLQCFFLLIRRSYHYPKRRTDGRAVMIETDLGCDTYTNRETFKIALYLFLLFSASLGFIYYGVSIVSQSTFCGCVGLIAIFSLSFMLMGLKTESITRWKLASILLITISSILTMAELNFTDWFNLKVFTDYSLYITVLGVLFLSLFFTSMARLTEHSSIQKPLIFAFIGLFCMISLWVCLIPFHVFGIEKVTFPPPKEDVYWHILGVAVLGCVIPMYLLQWVMNRTSVLYISVLLGSFTIPLHGISEAVQRVEWSWSELISSTFSVISIFLINYSYKQ